MKWFVLAMLLPVLAGCAMFQPSAYEFHQVMADGSTVDAKATLRPKDLTGGVSVRYGEFELTAGEARTAEDPLARMVEGLMPMMFCASNPVACAGGAE